MKKTHIIIGASAAGIGALNKLSKLVPDDQIICVTAQTELPYNTCFLADLMLDEKTEEQVMLVDIKKYPENVRFMFGTRVKRILADSKQLELSTNQLISYDTLFIGTGTSPWIPPIAGIHNQGVFTFHTLSDCHAMLSFVTEKNAKKAVVIGAGLTGLEAADALRVRGLSVSIVELQSHVLAHVMPACAAAQIESALKKQQIDFYPNTRVTEITSEKGNVTGVLLSDGRQLSADMVICATGAHLNSDLARSAGIECRLSGAIVTSDTMETSVPGIWAGGDVALVKSATSTERVHSVTWSDAMLQGMIAACAIAGQPKPYPGAVTITTTHFFALEVAWGGNLLSDSPLIEKHTELGYQAFCLVNGVIEGFLLIGDISALPAIRRSFLLREIYNV